MALQPMGLGKIGGPDIIAKKKHRFTFRIDGVCGGIGAVPEHFVKSASRPSQTIEATEINFLNAKTWIPGKPTWEEITVTYYDFATLDNMGLWNWIASINDITDPVNYQMASKRSDYAGSATLKMFDGCGTILEQWILNDVWPTAIKFGDLAMDSSDVAEIELTLRYSQVSYTSLCPRADIRSCCTSC